jgi:hypothetical protein
MVCQKESRCIRDCGLWCSVRWSVTLYILPPIRYDMIFRCRVSDHVLASRASAWIRLDSSNHRFRLPGSFSYQYLHSRVSFSPSQSKGKAGASPRSCSCAERQGTVQVAYCCSLLRVLGVSLVLNLACKYVLIDIGCGLHSFSLATTPGIAASQAILHSICSQL